jgi:hypothetical protein
VALSEEVDRIACAAAAFAEPAETVALVLAAEPNRGDRTYLCAYDGPGARRSWLALDGAGDPVHSRNRVREAVSIAVLCEVAEESAGGGDLGELRSQLAGLRLTEDPPGIVEAEDAALELERAVGAAPRVASPEYLDAVGAATIRLERTLGDGVDSPFTAAMRAATTTVEELAAEVERAYKGDLT